MTTTLTAYTCPHCHRVHYERPNRNPGHFCTGKGQNGKHLPLYPQPDQPEGDTAA